MNQRGMGFIGILIVVLIVGFMFYLMMKHNQSDSGLHQQVFKDTGIDTANYKTVLDSTKQIVNEASQRQSQ